jgi:hypothetical protein
MKSTTALILVSVLATTPAIAGSSDPTRGFGGTNLDNKGRGGEGGGVRYPSGPAQAYKPWSDDFIPFGSANTGVVTGAGLQGGFISTLTADELKAQQAANTAHRRALYNSLVNDGGCNAPFLPVEYSIPCSYNSFGKQTEGGSGSDGGSDSTE